MDEHDDDLESEVHEEAQEETDSYPDTDEELTQAAGDQTEDEGKEVRPDTDQSEL